MLTQLKTKRESTCMECPLFTLEVLLPTEDDSVEWQIIGIYFDAEERTMDLAMQRYRYPDDQRDKRWRVQTIPAAGETMRNLVRLTDQLDVILESYKIEILADQNRDLQTKLLKSK